MNNTDKRTLLKAALARLATAQQNPDIAEQEKAKAKELMHQFFVLKSREILGSDSFFNGQNTENTEK